MTVLLPSQGRVEVENWESEGREERGFLRPLRGFDAPGGVLPLQARDHQSWSVMAIREEKVGGLLVGKILEVV